MSLHHLGVGKVARTLALGRILALLVALLLCVPVALLPFATSVPPLVWVFLAIVDVALLILQFRLVPTWLGIAASLAGVIVVSLVAVAASQFFASTPPITDASGNPIPGSVATLEKVKLNASEQWISIRGQDVNKPVLLFLAGGPGGTDMAVTRIALGALEEHFVVVNWDQPGAGKSYHSVPHASLTPERYIADAHELTLYLRQRFGQAKIYVLGESWGSVLGIWLVQRYPELYHAFIGTGQMVAFKENDILCYEFALRWAQERGDFQKVEQLKRLGPPPYYGEGVAQKEATFLLDTLNVVYPQLWEVDLRQQAARLEVPVYLLKGRYDINAPTVLTEEYYQMLAAPHKELVWFERSGHNPWISEPARFVDVMVNTVLEQTQPAR